MFIVDATIFAQIADQCFDGRDLGRVDHQTSFLAGRNQPGLGEMREMKRQGVMLNTKAVAYYSCGRSLTPILNQDLEHPQPRFL